LKRKKVLRLEQKIEMIKVIGKKGKRKAADELGISEKNFISKNKAIRFIK
jgi:hypothetical protein